MRSWGPKGGGVTSSDIKKQLHLYLRGARETLVWKLEGLSEYDMRRPLTPTGTNLLGLVKHSTETQRHAGHADIIRELIDGSAGLLNGHDNLHIRDPAEQQRFREQVEAAAREFR